MTYPHLSVLEREIIHYFSDFECPAFVDGTLGAGGHSQAILKSHPEMESLYGIDQDPLALQIAQERLSPWKEKTTFIRGNFSNMKELLEKHHVEKVNGILLDIGVSSMQLDRAERGFSFMRDGPLDMRMNPDEPLTAAEIVNTWPEKELARIFRDYGEEKQWRAVARAIVEARTNFNISTTLQLCDVLMPKLGWRKGKGLHPMTLVFQALRICVNSELQVLTNVLPMAIDLLAPGGRLAIISFHSLEDRLVKNAFRHAANDKEDGGLDGLFLNKTPLVKLLTRKAVTPQDDEVKLNSRSSCAKLRVVEKLIT